MREKCEVCHKNKPATVVSSGLTAMSYAICEACLQVGAEPYMILVGNMVKKDQMREDVWPIYDVSLKVAGKTWDDLHTDIDELDRNCEQYYKEHMEDADSTHPQSES